MKWVVKGFKCKFSSRSDIEFCINNDLPIEVIETDIHQLISQLTAVLGKVKEGDNKKAFEIMNPAINYYKL